MILVVELPTPRIIKKKFKKYMTKERIGIYGLVIGGIIVICSNKVPVKVLPISALVYCVVAYEVIERSDFIDDPEILEYLLNYNLSNSYTYM